MHQLIIKEKINLNKYIKNKDFIEWSKSYIDKNFEYSIQLNLQDDPADLIIPSMLLQPFAENAVKHGLMHKAGPKELILQFNQSELGLDMYIIDNGIGRKQSALINQRNKSKPKSFATKAIAERIELFNRLYKQKILHNVTDQFDEHNYPSGTVIHIFIPRYEVDKYDL